MARTILKLIAGVHSSALFIENIVLYWLPGADVRASHLSMLCQTTLKGDTQNVRRGEPEGKCFTKNKKGWKGAPSLFSGHCRRLVIGP